MIIIVAITGRNKSYEALTWEWLRKNKLLGRITQILFRPDGDFTPDHELKIKLLENEFGPKEEVLKRIAFVIEDRDKVVEAYRNYGLPCWQVRPGSY